MWGRMRESANHLTFHLMKKQQITIVENLYDYTFGRVVRYNLIINDVHCGRMSEIALRGRIAAGPVVDKWDRLDGSTNPIIFLDKGKLRA